jgi:hypothetical protein
MRELFTPKGQIMSSAKSKKKPLVAKKPMAKVAPKKTADKKVLAKKPADKKAAVKSVKAAPSKNLVKTVGQIAGKALSALQKKDSKNAKASPKLKEQQQKELKKQKELALKQKLQAQKDAQKLKLQQQKEKELLKKQAEKEKLAAQKEKEKEKERLKAQKIKEQEEAKAAKKGQSSLNLKEGKGAKPGKDAKKGAGKKFAEEVEEVEVKKSLDEDDDEADFKRIAAKAKKSSKYEDADLEETPRSSKKYDKINTLEAKITEEIADLRENFSWKEIADAIASLEFFIDSKNDECIEKGCDNIRTTLSWCRLHYIKNWKSIQRKKEILQEGKLQEYIEELISKYPPKFVEAILSDLSDDRDFYKVLSELNITAEFDFEEEDLQAVDDDGDDDDLGIEARFTGSMRYEDSE